MCILVARQVQAFAATLLITAAVFGVTRTSLNAGVFIDSFNGPIEVFVFEKNSRISEGEFRAGLLLADRQNQIVHRQKSDSIFESNALVLFLGEWSDVHFAPLQQEFSEMYDDVAKAKPPSAILTYVLKLGSNEEYLVVVYNLTALSKPDADCLASDFVNSLNREIGEPRIERLGCF